MTTTTTIEAARPIATLINVFVVEPDRQAELVALLSSTAEKFMRDQPGFISANIHASRDGERVVNYAQWESEEHFQAMLADPAAREQMRHAAEVALSFDPRLFTVESTHRTAEPTHQA
ncbi:antibiotic biosynthesis monooxygenase family protein [Streptomyces sp. H27-D2]|uniref:antibiotic biosynthesis monooxygenase family protein n=1 Tax=Streptomyces sp. H27-D2 TaxID=3046304 RepID=UPI002DBE66B5|nr:antibiotic biosynthesis monooxygenase family protein [Streptomyces sp. H27-D2]MEC4018589.1 antibiotic biosynthesis monooxygenase family protein [Streptomyces sp. H27-D2]